MGEAVSTALRNTLISILEDLDTFLYEQPADEPKQLPAPATGTRTTPVAKHQLEPYALSPGQEKKLKKQRLELEKEWKKIKADMEREIDKFKPKLEKPLNTKEAEEAAAVLKKHLTVDDQGNVKVIETAWQKDKVTGQWEPVIDPDTGEEVKKLKSVKIRKLEHMKELSPEARDAAAKLMDLGKGTVSAVINVICGASGKRGDCSAPDRDDMSQEGLVRLMTAAAQHNPAKGKLASWLFGQLKFHLLNTYEAKRSLKRVGFGKLLEPMTMPTKEMGLRTVGGKRVGAEPLGGYEKSEFEKELKQEIEKGLSALSAKEQEIVKKAYGIDTDEMSVTDIAKEKGLTKGTISFEISKATDKLKQKNPKLKDFLDWKDLQDILQEMRIVVKGLLEWSKK